jgi:predicted small secreted protein
LKSRKNKPKHEPKQNEDMKNIIQRLALALIAISLTVAATGCRTAHGAGEDIENMGEKIQDGTN